MPSRLQRPFGDGTKIAIQYPDGMVPRWFPEFFGEVATAYWHAATKPEKIALSHYSGPIAAMVGRYFQVNKLEPYFYGAPKALPELLPLYYGQDTRRAAVMLSGGKDSVHLLLRLIENGWPKDHLFAVYVKNLNRSETYYETRAVERICEKIGVPYEIVRPVNSVKLNRMGHNIAFREPLCVALALPHLLERKIGTVYFGNLNAFVNIEPPMYCANRECLEFLNVWLAAAGPKFVFKHHIDHGVRPESGIFEDMVRKWPEILALTSSCYRQLNFRERQYALFKKGLPSVPIYEGCGNCIKCLRINSAILLFDERARTAPEKERRRLWRHLEEWWAKYYSKDIWLTDHLTRLRPEYQ